MNDEINNTVLHLSLIERVAFFTLKTSRRVQEIISQIYWHVIALPILFASLKFFGDENFGYRRINFKREKIIQFIFGKIVLAIIAFNGVLNGLRANHQYYNFLLRWNPSIPLIALANQQAISPKQFGIYWLGKEHEQNKGMYNLEQEMRLGTSKVSGYFRIVSKQISGDSSVRINCVWISGDKAGKRFVVTELGLFDTGTRGELPDSIYFPPSGIVWLFEMMASLSLVTLVGGIVYKIWKDFGADTIFNWIIQKL